MGGVLSLTARTGSAAAVAEEAAAAVEPGAITEALEVLVAGASANGAEADLAGTYASWGMHRHRTLRWRTDVFDGTRANLWATSGNAIAGSVGVYAHLDTSLTGDVARDRWITGRDDDPAPLRVVDGDVIGHGIAVAKGSAAAATIACAVAADALTAAGLNHRIDLLLASGGTHRLVVPADGGAPAFGPGVRRALGRGWRPTSVLNVKAGAPAPIAEEPGAAYLRVRLDGSWDPVLFRGEDPGLLAALGPLQAAVESARRELRARAVPVGSTSGRELGLGAVRSGALDKPDLLPAVLEAGIFAVLVPGDDPDEVARLVDAELQRSLAAAGVTHLRQHVTVEVAEHGAATDRTEPLVQLVDDVWTKHLGPPPAVTDWRGSTDSVVLRAAGIPTVRCGPPVGRDPDDLRLDRVPLAELVTFAQLWAEVIVLEALRTAGPVAPDRT